MITLADEPLLIGDPDRRLVDFLDTFQPLEDLQAFSGCPTWLKAERRTMRAGHRVGLPALNWPTAPPPRLNSLYWPTGATRWARGYFLATKTTMEAVVANGPRSLKLKMGDDSNPNNPLVQADVWLLPPRQITAFAPAEGDDQLWLLTLVDARYWWQFSDLGNFQVTKSTTWTNLFSQLSDQLRVAIEIDAVPAAYLNPDPAEFGRQYENAAMLLDAAAASVGCRVVVGLDGAVKVQKARNAVTPYLANVQSGDNAIDAWTQVAGGDFSTGFKPVPSKVSVVFHKFSWGHAWCGDKVAKYDFNAPVDMKSVTGRDKTIHSTCYADYSCAGYSANNPDNHSALQSLTDQIGSDFYDWQKKQYDLTYNGIKKWVPCGFDNYIEFAFGTQQSVTRRWFAHTRVQSLPIDFGTIQQCSQKPNLNQLGDNPVGVVCELDDIECDLDNYDENKIVGVTIHDGTPGSETDSGINVVAFKWPHDREFQVNESVSLAWNCGTNAWYPVDASFAFTWIKLIDTLNPGSITTGRRVQWDQATADWEEVDENEDDANVWDYVLPADARSAENTNLAGLTFGLKNEVIKCYYDPRVWWEVPDGGSGTIRKQGAYVPIDNGWTLDRFGKVAPKESPGDPDQAAAPGESCTVRIYTKGTAGGEHEPVLATDANGGSVEVETWLLKWDHSTGVNHEEKVHVRWDPYRAEWRILPREIPAEYVTFTLDAPRLTWSGGTPTKADDVAATVTFASGSTAKIGDTITVTFIGTQFLLARSGAAGIANYDSKNEKWRVVQCDQVAESHTINLSSDLPETATSAVSYLPSGSQPTPIRAVYPFSQSIDSAMWTALRTTGIANAFMLAGVSGDNCDIDITVSGTTVTARLVEVKHHVLRPLVGIQWNSSDKRIEVRQTTVAVCTRYTNDPPWTLGVQFEECET